MFNQPTVTATGASGTSYTFTTYPWGQAFNPAGAVYLVLRHKGNTNYDLLYVGQTGNLAERFDNHHKQPCFNRNGKTHIAVLPEPREASRLQIETDLIRNYNPDCNG